MSNGNENEMKKKNLEQIVSVNQMMEKGKGLKGINVKRERERGIVRDVESLQSKTRKEKWRDFKSDYDD